MKSIKMTLAAISLMLLSASIAGAGQENGDQALAEGWRLFNIGSYQEAHDNFRIAWKTESLRENAGQ
ncbi:MAG: hypothetical protein OEY50_07170, partial [Nitrospinota bacterium]|nr:hypothetical protein [Nitrospinota bacterium]